MKTIRINELNSLLEIWEQQNIQGELNLSSRAILDDTFFGDSLPGSELNDKGIIARPIVNYELLRTSLAKKEITNPFLFLPRIPKYLREKLTPDDLLHNGINNHINLVPFFLQNWSFAKKTCLINKSNIIPEINPAQENFFKYLPYSCFLLKLETGIIIQDKMLLEQTGFKIEVKNFIFCKLNELCLEIFLIPDNIDSFRQTPEEEKQYLDFIKEIKNCGKKASPRNKSRLKHKIYSFMKNDFESRPKNPPVMNVSLLLENGRILFQGKDGVLKSLEMESYNDDGAEIDYSAQTVFMANGLCKLFSELEPTEINQIISDSSTEKNYPTPKQKINENVECLAWNELFIGQVKKVTLEKKDGVTRIKSIIGGEKSPHLRRGHTRHFFNDKGELIKKVWIPEMIIREDKLKATPIHGSSLELK